MAHGAGVATGITIGFKFLESNLHQDSCVKPHNMGQTRSFPSTRFSGDAAQYP